MDFEELLRVNESPLANVLRAALAGLAQTLDTAHGLAAPTDPGRAACARLVASLRTVAQAGRASPTAEFRPRPPGTPAAPRAAVPVAGATLASLDVGFAERLRETGQRLLATPEARVELGDVALPPGDESVLWLSLHLLALRLSPGPAAAWKAALRQAAGDLVSNDPVDCDALPWDQEEAVFPGLRGPRQVRGLRLTPDAQPDPRLGDSGTGAATVLARVASVALWLGDHDTTLHHGLHTLFRFGLVPLQGPQKERYQAALVERWQRLAAAEREGRAGEALEAWADCDEAIHSLLHSPPAPTSSWWGRVQRRGRDLMPEVRERAIAAGRRVHLRDLSGRYADVRRYADRDDQQVAGSAAPGDVSVCLRVYLRLDETETNGRVFYRGR